MSRKTLLRGLMAGAAALALGMAGALGMSSSASAAPGVTCDINANTVGSIIIHKHVEDVASTPRHPKGAPLKGVTFQVSEVLKGGQPIALGTAEGWESIRGVKADAIGVAGFTIGATDRFTTNGDGVVTASTLQGKQMKVGLYLVEEIDPGQHVVAGMAAPFLVTLPTPEGNAWDYNVDVFPKNVLSDVLPVKTVNDPIAKAATTAGAEVSFGIQVPVAKGTMARSFDVTDHLGAGLTFVKWDAVQVGEDELHAQDYSISADNSTISLVGEGLLKLASAAGTGDVKVSATVTTKITGIGKIANQAEATIDGVTGTTAVVTTNWARLDVEKVDAAALTTPLQGAKFELYASDRVTKIAEGTTDASGLLSFSVWVGNNDAVTKSFFLKEVGAPQGYVLPADPMSNAIKLTAGDADHSVLSYTVSNVKAVGPQLPLTGSTGSLGLWTGGAVLVILGAVVMVISRRRREA